MVDQIEQSLAVAPPVLVAQSVAGREQQILAANPFCASSPTCYSCCVSAVPTDLDLFSRQRPKELRGPTLSSIRDEHWAGKDACAAPEGSAWRVAVRVLVSDCPGSCRTIGSMIHPSPLGTSRVSEMARHSTYTPPFPLLESPVGIQTPQEPITGIGRQRFLAWLSGIVHLVNPRRVRATKAARGV
jgi:hypothetical protein